MNSTKPLKLVVLSHLKGPVHMGRADLTPMGKHGRSKRLKERDYSLSLNLRDRNGGSMDLMIQMCMLQPSAIRASSSGPDKKGSFIVMDEGTFTEEHNTNEKESK
jgi:hypothetical protein